MRGKFSVDIAFDFCGADWEVQCAVVIAMIYYLVHSSLEPPARKKMNAQQPGKGAVATENSSNTIWWVPNRKYEK